MITGAAKLAGVMGWPVKHSRSPRLHGYWLEKHQIDGLYAPFAVKPEDLAKALRALPALGVAGVNLTVPHKEAALGIVDYVDSVAKRIGAINTVTVGSDGALTGINTDVYGFIAHLRQEIPNWTPTAPVVVLGAGGAARAVVAALADAHTPEIRVLNRTRARAEALADLAPTVRAMDWEQRSSALADVGLLVNTTTLGMTGQRPLDIDLAKLPETSIVYDIVYAPLETELLMRAEAHGCRIVDGLGMLLHQARPAFRAFFGVDPEVTPELRAHVMTG